MYVYKFTENTLRTHTTWYHWLLAAEGRRGNGPYHGDSRGAVALSIMCHCMQQECPLELRWSSHHLLQPPGFSAPPWVQRAQAPAVPCLQHSWQAAHPHSCLGVAPADFQEGNVVSQRPSGNPPDLHGKALKCGWGLGCGYGTLPISPAQGDGDGLQPLGVPS